MIAVQPNREEQARLDRLLLEDGKLKVVTAEFYRQVAKPQLQLFCHRHAFYGLPTTELVDWLKLQIDGRSAIEIGAGNGVLGAALGIPCTDSWVQATAECQQLYRSLRQPTINYPAHVEKLEAGEAIRKYRPEVVVGCYVTQRTLEGDRPESYAQSFAFGIDEEYILDNVKSYILIGNEQTHGQKRIMARSHATAVSEFIVTRASEPQYNRIYIWERR